MATRIAIVEDNATARASLRSHLLPIGDFEVLSFSTGAELKAMLRKQNVEIVLLDYHLGQRRTGVEWVQHLRKTHFIKPSTGIMFLTSDRLPQTIGQIIDVHPDLLMIKPYTIATLTRAIEQYMRYRRWVEPVLRTMDDQRPAEALEMLQRMIKQGDMPAKIRTDVTKLLGRLLFDNGQVIQAQHLYESVLVRSDKVLWAQWGKIKCQYVAGNWSEARNHLSHLLSTSLSRDKAFEWLACLCFQQEAYSQAEFYLDHINVSELSVPATKLKSLTYQRQNRVIEGIDLLQKKRDANRGASERFNEFTFELAEFYLQIAEQAPFTNRTESLEQARKLVGIAGRSQGDAQLVQKRDYLLAFAATLEGDQDRATALVNTEHMDSYQRTDTTTLVVAAKVHNALGEKAKAKEIMSLAHARSDDDASLAEQVNNATSLLEGDRQMGLANDQALLFNDKGTRHFINKAYVQAMHCFYQAYTLVPFTAAFGLNLLQCMVESKTPLYRNTSIATMLSKLAQLSMNDINQSRLTQLRTEIELAPEVFFPPQEGPELITATEEKVAESAQE